MNTNANACTILLLVLNHFLFPFLDSKRAKVFAGFFEQGQPMWDAMSKCADIEMPTPSSILDLGSGPGEPACYFARSVVVLLVDQDEDGGTPEPDDYDLLLDFCELLTSTEFCFFNSNFRGRRGTNSTF